MVEFSASHQIHMEVSSQLAGSTQNADMIWLILRTGSMAHWQQTLDQKDIIHTRVASLVVPVLGTQADRPYVFKHSSLA